MSERKDCPRPHFRPQLEILEDRLAAGNLLPYLSSYYGLATSPHLYITARKYSTTVERAEYSLVSAKGEKQAEEDAVFPNEEQSLRNGAFTEPASQAKTLAEIEAGRFVAHTHDPFAQADTEEQYAVSQEKNDSLPFRAPSNGASNAEHLPRSLPNSNPNNNPPNLAGAYAGASQGPGGVSTPNPSGGGSSGGNGGSANLHLPSQTQLQQMTAGANNQTPSTAISVGHGSGAGSHGHNANAANRTHILLAPSDGGGLSWVQGGNAPEVPPQWSQDIDGVPTVTAPSGQVNTEGDNVSLQIQASTMNDSDQDSDSLNYAALDLPPGLSINTSTGLISGTIAYKDAATFDGTYNPIVIVSDAENSSASTSFSWTINPAPIAPVLNNPGNHTNFRGDNVSLQLSASQIDNNPLTYSASNLPTGLCIDPETGLISGTVDLSATLGVPYVVTATATDNTTNLSANQSFNWTINAANVAPVLTSPSNVTNSAGDPVSLQLSATDADGDALTYTATGLPPGLTLDPVAGTIAGTLPNSAASSTPYNVTVTSSDGMASNSQSFTWTVNAVRLQNPGAQSNLDGDSVSLQPLAGDANNATLTYGASGLPSGLSINSSTGLISGTIASNADTNSPYSVILTATDSNHNSVSQSFAWTVSRLAMNSESDQENQEGTSVSLQLSATDREGTPTYSASGLPPGLTISSTGLISGAIGIGSFGSSPYQVTATATDGSYTSSVSFVWTVTPRVALVNPGDQSNAEGDTVSLQLSATSPGGAMSYSASGLPSGLGINSSTGLISGTLYSGDASNSPYTVTVTANDGTSSSSQTFAWNVSVINLVAPGDQTNNDGDTVSLPLTTGYHGSGTLSYSATGLPPGLSINSSTGQITGKITGTADTSSPYSVTVSVTDGTNTTSQSFNWAINAVVSIVALDDQSNAAGDAVSLQVAASDSLNNTLTYSATNLPAGLSINSTSGLIGGTIAVGADGGSPYAVTITVTDSAGNSASLSFNWTVMHVSLVNPGPLWNVDGQSVSLQLQGHDSDGDKVSYTASGLPGGLSISTSTGLISGIIASNADTNSPYNVTLTAGDGAHTTTQTFLWTVSQVALTLPSDQTNTEGDNVSLQLQGTASTGSLSYNASGLPAGLSLNPATGLISGILASGDAANGPYTVNASVNNGKDSTSQSFNWTINPVVNLTAPVDQSNSVGNNVSLQISTTDTLHRTLTYSAAGLPSGLNVNSSTGLISGTITGGDPNGGPYVVTVTAADGIYSSSASFNWNVTDTAALTVTAPGTQDNVASDSVVNLQVRASDPDGDALTFSTTNLPDGLTIDPITGIISGSIADDAAGPAPYQTTVTATDGNGQSVSQTFTWIVNAPPIVAQAMPLNFTEGIDPGPFTIATFTTPDLNSLPDDFGAIITYGDGTTDSGAISGGNGSFTVTTDHIYAEKGTYPVSIQIFNGLTGGSTTTSTTATVADAALTLTGFQLGDPGDDLQTSFVVGYLTDANPDATIADFSETINTGTGLLMGRNYLEQIGPGRFLVILPQGYPTPYPNTNMQTYSVSVSVTDVDGDSVSSSSEIDAGLIVADVPATMTNWVFEDLNSNATAGEFNITVDWGDGTSSPDQAIFFAGGNGNPTIWGLAAVTHTYVQDSYDQPNGRYQITVTITSSDGDLTGIQYVSVMRSPLQQYTGNVNIASNLTVSNAEVAVFTVADSLDPVSEFTAQIDWGDGTTGSGTIQELAPGLYQVVGSHTYATYDWYTLTVTISQSWQAPVGADRGVGIVGGKPIVEILNPFPLKSLKVSKWETAFQRVGTTQPPESMPILRLRHDFPLGDNASFFLDVKDQAAASKTSINVHVSTSSDPAGHDIVLRNIFGGNGPGWFSSLTLPGGGWLLLTSVAADKTQLGNAGFMVKLGDTIRATYDGQEATATVPVKKRVNLHINVLRLTRGGNPVATRGKVNGDVNWANQIYAQVGIRFDVEGPINFVNPPPGVNLGNGLTVTFPGLAAEQRALLESYRTPADNDIDMYYVNRMVFLGGAPGPIGFAYPADIYNGLNARYADSIIIGADFEVYTTLAHEIAHILLNPGLPHPNPRVWGVNIVNVLSVPYWVNGWVTDSRRITANQDREMLNGPNSRKNLLLNP